jgi:hypothetical protein
MPQMCDVMTRTVPLIVMALAIPMKSLEIMDATGVKSDVKW